MFISNSELESIRRNIDELYSRIRQLSEAMGYKAVYRPSHTAFVKKSEGDERE